MEQPSPLVKVPPRWFSRLANGDKGTRQVMITTSEMDASTTRELTDLWDFVSGRQNAASARKEMPQ